MFGSVFAAQHRTTPLVTRFNVSEISQGLRHQSVVCQHAQVRVYYPRREVMFSFTFVSVCVCLSVRETLVTRVKISHLVASLPTSRQQVVFALLVPSCQQVWNKQLTNCNKIVDNIRLVARLFPVLAILINLRRQFFCHYKLTL